MKFSIITPCFNSSKILQGAYESLLAIKEGDFEWILVDDASPDSGETMKLMEEIKKTAPFLVKTVFLDENFYGSKSVYKGALIASGDYICILDHDDRLMPDALEIVEKKLEEHTDKINIAGVVGRCIDQDGKLIGKDINIDLVGTEGDLRFKKKFESELIQFTRRDLVVIFFEKMKPGYTNGFVWANISLNHQWIYTNNVFRVYDMKYEHSFTNSEKKKITYPSARAESIEAAFLTFKKYYAYNPWYSLKFIGSAIRYKLHAKVGIKKAVGHTLLGTLIYAAAIPMGLLRYLADIKGK